MKHKPFPAHILSRLGTVEYWKSLNPGLTITNRPFLQPAPQLGMDLVDTDRYVSQIQQEGYFKLDEVLPKSDMSMMADAITRLVDQGFPPSFAYVYDEFWQVFRNLSPLMAPILGEKCLLSTNLWAWHIPSTGKDAGFAAHRDIVNAPAMRADGTPLMATVWIPLRDVTTSHACMHVLPLNRDPNVPDNMESVDIPAESIQSIRALPARAGSILSWNMDTVHWSSCSSKWADGPRISIAAYLASTEGPNITSIGMEPAQPLTLDFRLGIIGNMMTWFNEADLDKNEYPSQLLSFCEKYYHCEPTETRFNQPDRKEPNQARQAAAATAAKVGRNEPCPCGSGKKYKHCHGK